MKYILPTIIAAIVAFSSPVVYAAETKRVCIDQRQKDGKSKQVCKDVKVHKKLEGTSVPPAKK